MKIYYCSGTRAVRVVWLFQELGLDYDLVKLEFHPRVLKSDAHRAIHPLGRVPVLQDGDMTMFESGAIVQYVLDRYAGGSAPTGNRFTRLCALPAVVSLL